MSQSADEFIMGGGAPTAKFRTIGTTVRGEIIDTGVSQQREWLPSGGFGDLLYWKDGSPRMQAVITIQTDERDPEIADDDGKRRLFVSSRNMREAIRDAVTTAGKRHLEIGGKLAVQYTGDGKTTGSIPPKLYTAQYKAPERSAVSADDLLSGPF